MVLGLLGNASIVLPLVKSIRVFWICRTLPLGSFSANRPILLRTYLLCRRLGATPAIWVDGLVSAVQRIKTLTTSVFPLCLDPGRQRNLLVSNRCRCWSSVVLIPRNLRR